MVDFLVIIRNDIGDDLPVGSGQIYSDIQIVTFMERALLKINGSLETTFIVNASGVIAPSGSAKENDAIVLCTECLIGRRELKKGARDAIKAKQDENTIDTSVGLTTLRENTANICRDARLLMIELRREVTAGIHGDIIWAGNERLFEEVDFDGTGSNTIEGVNIDLE